MRAALIAIVLVVAGSAAAFADVRDDAKRAFADGQAADRRGDWQAAIEAYLRAYDAVPHPFALYNIASDYEQLQRFRDAAHYYDLYLQAPEATDRDKVKKQIADLRAHPAKLSIKSDPDGAKVAIDGQTIGTTPYTGRLKGGTHRIVVEQGESHDQKTVTVEFGEPVDVSFTLDAGSGTLAVDGTPVGAKITVDGSEAGAIPLSTQLAAGEHTMSITQDGFAPRAETITIAANKTTEIHAHLVGTAGGATDSSVVKGYYDLGVGGGADVRGNGAAYDFELGLRASTYELVVTIGKVVSETSVEVQLRYALTKGRLQPILGGGYSYIGNKDATSGSSSSSSALGVEAFAGLRADIVAGDTLGISLLGLMTARYRTTTDSSGGSDPSKPTGIFPFSLTLQVYYRINNKR